MADVCFSTTDVFIYQPSIDIMSTKFGLLMGLTAAISTNAKPEIVFSGRHLDKAI